MNSCTLLLEEKEVQWTRKLYVHTRCWAEEWKVIIMDTSSFWSLQKRGTFNVLNIWKWLNLENTEFLLVMFLYKIGEEHKPKNLIHHLLSFPLLERENSWPVSFASLYLKAHKQTNHSCRHLLIRSLYFFIFNLISRVIRKPQHQLSSSAQIGSYRQVKYRSQAE